MLARFSLVANKINVELIITRGHLVYHEISFFVGTGAIKGCCCPLFKYTYCSVINRCFVTCIYHFAGYFSFTIVLSVRAERVDENNQYKKNVSHIRTAKMQGNTG